MGAEQLIAAAGLLVGFVGAVTAWRKVGPERQTTLVTAQDVVIENLREELDRAWASRDRAWEQYKARIEQALADEREACDVRIREIELRHGTELAQLRERLDNVEHETRVDPSDEPERL